MGKDGEQPGIESQELPSTNNASTKDYTQCGEDRDNMDKDSEQPGPECQEVPSTNNTSTKQLNSKLTDRRNPLDLATRHINR
jgi:hypothetical protein